MLFLREYNVKVGVNVLKFLSYLTNSCLVKYLIIAYEMCIHDTICFCVFM